MLEDNWWLIYIVMKSLEINELTIDKKYLEIKPEDMDYMAFSTDTKTNKIKVIIKENDEDETKM